MTTDDARAHQQGHGHDMAAILDHTHDRAHEEASHAGAHAPRHAQPTAPEAGAGLAEPSTDAIAASVRIAALSEQPLDLAAHIAAVTGPTAGAVATFLGQVRDHDPDVTEEVVRLDYSAHPDAERILRELAARFARDDVKIAVTHRTGTLAVGDAAIVAAVASAHRAEAFDVCRALVEAVKAELPVWKRQHAASGSSNWVGIT